jgi:glucose/arabinose dehydrogenase
MTKVGLILTFLMGTCIVCCAASSALSAYDVAWTFGNSDFTAYVLNHVEPSGSDLGIIGTQNPTLTLHLGRRYQVTAPSSHPFEVIARGSDAAQDTFLLSTGEPAGSFEADPQVNWLDNGFGTVTFTLTLDLYDAMIAGGKVPGYRCRPHAFSMRGNFSVKGLPLADPIPEPVQKGSIKIELETVASGLAAPLLLVPIPGQTDRLLVMDQSGKAYVIQNEQLQPVPFLDVTSRIVSPLGVLGTHDEKDYDERGLLGLAFHPGFADPQSPGYRKVYTYTSEPVSGPADFTTSPLPPSASFDHQSVIAEWSVSDANPDIVDPATRREIMRIDQPQFNHNAGMLAFGPDGYLYIALGDGGAANDVGNGHGPGGNGQNINTAHGSILRIDAMDPALTAGSPNPVSANGRYRIPAGNPFVGTAGLDEIFAFGFRNPYRFSFDRLTDRLLVADVGQNFIEEIDVVQRGGNYGWNLKEGTFRFDPVTGNVTDDLFGLPAGLLDPVAEYDHDEGSSIIGGYVYRGSAIPELAGKYVFGDFSTGFVAPDGRLFYADLTTGQIHEFVIGHNDRRLGLFVKGFGQDAAGELYVLASPNLGPYGSQGVVLKIVDLCLTRLAGDLDNDCQVNFADLAVLASNWLACALRPPANCP